MTSDSLDRLKARLRGDLKTAMQAKRAVEMKALRGLLGAIDNAQAVPVAETRYVARKFGDESVEVARIALSDEDLRALLVREAAAHREAAAEMARFGRADRAGALEAEAAIVERYLAG
jgi:uncharacterized protein YqeY